MKGRNYHLHIMVLGEEFATEIKGQDIRDPVVHWYYEFSNMSHD